MLERVVQALAPLRRADEGGAPARIASQVRRARLDR